MTGRSNIVDSRGDGPADAGALLQRVLITGGFGYLGGRLALHLATRKSIELLLGTRNARAVEWLPTATAVAMDFRDEHQLRNVCKGVDAVVHLAALNAQESAADPVGALETNAVATARLVRAATAAGVRRFLYVSTAHVYGSPLQGRIDEQTRPTNLHPYATSHLSGEHAVLYAAQKGSIEGVVVRLSNAFGAPADLRANCFSLLVNGLCREAVLSRRLTLMNPADRRDFIPMADACVALDHLLHLDRTQLRDGMFNVGRGQACSVAEIARMIADGCEQELGFRPQIVEPSSGKSGVSLHYRIDRLLETGYVGESAMQAEISATLKLFALNRELLPV
jgi:UDP-glucose 4-epimerase